MAEEGQENWMNEDDNDQEHQEWQKSKKSILPEGFSSGDIKLKPQIYLFRQLMENHYDNTLRLNEMTGRPEYLDRFSKRWREWTDTQESQLRAYFQSTYGLYSPKMLEDAIRIHFEAHKVNPLIEILESLQWDGKPRVEQFLHDVMKADDSDYVRECSRLIFAGGIHRAYQPGCKFDDMIVLIGGQSAGKSTIVRWLNIEDRFFREIKTISGKEGIEAIRGVWIGEVAELMAMTRVKESEAVKAYITSQEDSYRPPYQKNVKTIPRRCMFVGTTNNPQFLTDKTGNRRFYPVKVNSSAYAIYQNEGIIRDYIRQAWAEAVHLYREDQLQPFAKQEVLDVIRAAQEQAMEDDWRIGAIQQYLEDQKQAQNATISVIELWHRALNEPEESKPTRKDSIEITQIIASIPGWVSGPNKISTQWGRQKYFRKDNFAALWK
jgi:predicted P-loop ATPase